MQRKSYLPGEVVRLTLEVKTPAGEPTDPGSVQLKIQSATGLKVSIPAEQVTKDSVGAYHSDFQIPFDARPGVWAWRWDLTAPNAGASEGIFTVQRSMLA